MRTMWWIVIGSLMGCMDVEDLGQQEQELGGRIGATTDAMTLSPFTGAFIDRTMFFARVVGNSTAFAQCVDNTMEAQYSWCTAAGYQDPYEGYPRPWMMRKAWERFRTWNNNLVFYREFPDNCRQLAATCTTNADCCSATCVSGRCASDGWVGAAHFTHATGNPYGTHRIKLSDGYHRDAPGWDLDVTPHYEGSEPWGFYAGVQIHEYMHTLGYLHDDCYGTYEGGAPYIYGRCATEVLRESHARCSLSCPVGTEAILQSWNGIAESAQGGGTCSCVQDPRHLVAFRSVTSGTVVTATSGGGGSLVTNTTTGIGAWQLMYATDANGGSWVSGDPVDVKTHHGHHFGILGSTLGASSLTPGTITIHDTRLGLITRGDRVTLRAPTGQLAANNGAQLVLLPASATTPAAEFVLEEPRRDHLVFIRTAHDRFVNSVVGSSLAWNQLRHADVISDDVGRQAPASFWVIDWNGGELRSGDTISLQRYAYDSYAFLSARDGDHTGQLVFSNAVDVYERFVIDLGEGATGAIGHGSAVTFRSANGTYLTAMPPDYFDSQLRNYGTWIGPWQRFSLYFVEHYDRLRPAWN